MNRYFNTPRAKERLYMVLCMCCMFLLAGNLVFLTTYTAKIGEKAPIYIECDPTELEVVEKATRVLEELRKEVK